MKSTATSVPAPPLIDPVTDYAQKVIAGTIIAGPHVRGACRRHLTDLETGHERGLRWSPEHAEFTIGFAKFLHHTKGEWRGQPIELDDWQQFIVGSAYGWLKQEPDGSWIRRYRTIYVEVPKKNGKSTMCSFVGIYGLIADGEPGAEIYAAATARKQAKLVFDEAKEMVRISPALRSKIAIVMNNLSHQESYSKFEPISSDENTGDGINPHFAIFDELHRLKNRSLLTVLQQGFGARRQPMLWIITTAGNDRPNTAYDDEHNYAKKIAEGSLDDDTYFSYLACPDEGDDPFAHETWIKANPGFGKSVKERDLAALAAKARTSADQLADFKRFRLNVRSADASAAIKVEIWARNGAAPIDENKLAGRKCYTAIDLSAKTDITCLVHLFPPENEGDPWIILPRFWVPEEGLADREVRDRAPYARWVQEGWITATPGNRVDYNAVFAGLKKDGQAFKIEEVVFDPWNAGTIEADATAEGFRVVEFGQRTVNYAHPTKEFLGMLPDALFDHGCNPVLKWMASNLVLVKDHNDNPMPSKRKSTGRIDGIAATIMAFGRALEVPEETGSVFDREELWT